MTNKTSNPALRNHAAAMESPRAGFETAILVMLRGLRWYAEAHSKRYESPIGDDGVLGESWAQGLRALRGLLNGETGRFDCGTLDSEICALAKAHGVEL